MRKLEFSAANFSLGGPGIAAGRTKRAERTELTADWVVDDHCGDLKFSWRIDHAGIMLASCWHHVGIMLGDAFERWRLRQARMSQSWVAERSGEAETDNLPQLGERIDDRIDHRSTSLAAGTDAKPIGRRRYFAERGSQKWRSGRWPAPGS